MTNESRQQLIKELTEVFGEAEDVTPAEDQPLHALLPRLVLPSGWKPSPARALLKFGGWPETRPEFYIDPTVTDLHGTPPRNNGGSLSEPVLVLGASWRAFSFPFAWPPTRVTATRAVRLWMNRFALPA